MTVRAPGRLGHFALRPTKPAGWWLDVAMLAGFALITAVLALTATSGLTGLDLTLRDAADAHRPTAAESAAVWVNRLGSGGILSVAALGVAAIVAIRVRTLWPLAPVVTAFALTSAVVWPLKQLSDRAAPHSPLPDAAEVRLFSQTDGLSYPSGHAVNAIVWYGVICLLLAPWLAASVRRWCRWLPPIAVTAAGVYLGYHWLTDVLAGLCVGVLIDRALARIPWPPAGITGVRPEPPSAAQPPRSR